jgi:type I restriction enzyme S subunit
MSKIEELISELCPEGVEVRSMGSIGSFVRGQRFVKEDMRPEGQPCIHYGEVYTKYQLEASTAFSFLEPAQATRLRKAQPGDVVIAAAGETIEDIGKPVVWRGNGDVVIHDALYAFRSPLNPKFVAYFLRTDDFKTQARRLISSSKISAISIANFGKINIPNPPLGVQREIVSILDKFTQLEAELEAELKARKTQFKHHRGVLFKLESSHELPLAQICTRISSGGTPSRSRQDFFEGPIPWVRTQEVNFDEIWKTELCISEDAMASSSTKWVPKNTVIVAMYGATAAKVAIAKIPLTTNQACANLEVNSQIANYRYVFHYLMNSYENLKSLGQGTQSNLSLQQIKLYPIKLPPIETQNQIAEHLDTLFELSNSESGGIPAELTARRKQYEYYRDKLLTFKELETA